jgi:hypothetical protein
VEFMQGNSFITYLDQFNVLSPNHSKIYDEYTHGTDLGQSYHFTISTKVETHLKNIFLNNPHSVILTGNAGDGKTRLCRLIYDQFSDNELRSWPDEGIISIQYEKGTIKIVKDLSELKEDVIYKVLHELQECIRTKHANRTFMLIAANEGKLTKTLSKYRELDFIREHIMKRFASHKNNDENLSIINLLDVTSSVYVERVLQEWNKEEYWEACNNCYRKSHCIIYLNHRRTSKLHVQQRIVDQYRLLDYLETHITMREMLIHMSYLLTGGFTCKDIIEASYYQVKDHAKKVYYQNFYGIETGEEAFSEMRALKVFKALDPGIYSQSVIDDFIVNGDINGDPELEEIHRKVFDNELDMEFDYFRKNIKFYREHSQDGNNSLLENWIPRLRRKLYFELDDFKYFNTLKLLPFEYISEYISLFNDKNAQAKIRKDLVNGLNRAFSYRLVQKQKNNFQLKATNENLMIYASFSKNQVELHQETSRDDLDHLPSIFYLVVDGKIKLRINLSVFEYLMRLNAGGTHNILSQEVEILLNTFRNELIQISDQDECTLEIYRLDRKSGLYVEDEISL